MPTVTSVSHDPSCDDSGYCDGPSVSECRTPATPGCCATSASIGLLGSGDGRAPWLLIERVLSMGGQVSRPRGLPPGTVAAGSVRLQTGATQERRELLMGLRDRRRGQDQAV